jgi:lichenan operon transcriptional antiterminator
LTEDEISYVAVHFLGILEKKITQKSTNRILIISQYRKSDTILLKQKIFRYIENLNEIDIVPEFALKSDDFLSYDAILTTEKDIAQKYPNIRFINYFLNDSDLKKIEFALKGVNSIDDILDKFDRDMFIVDKFNNKDEIIKALYLKAKSKFNLDDRLFKSVMLHEERYSSSYFGNGIAIPHPEELITDMTFISVANLKNEVYWDNDFNVRMVLLISIEKNNPKSLQLWNHLSLLISNERFISSIDKVESFEDFISSVKDVFKEYF